jgi:hypothetical protein
MMSVFFGDRLSPFQNITFCPISTSDSNPNPPHALWFNRVMIFTVSRLKSRIFDWILGKFLLFIQTPLVKLAKTMPGAQKNKFTFITTSYTYSIHHKRYREAIHLSIQIPLFGKKLHTKGVRLRDVDGGTPFH